MTARSKSRRQANRKLKNEKNKMRELKRLQKLKADGNELMEICSEVVDEKKLEEIKQKQLEQTIREEFIEEEKEKIEASTSKKNNNNKNPNKKKKKGKTMKIKNDKSGKVHEYDVKTLKDQYGTYPPWLNVKNHVSKIKRKKTAIRKNQFHTGSVF